MRTAFLEYDFAPMRIEHLAKLYDSKTDEELLHLASDAKDLTDEARTALRSELARRRIQTTGSFVEEVPRETRSSQEPVVMSYPTGVVEFVAEAVGLYHRHFWLFFRMVVPAVAIGWFAIVVANQQAAEIARHLLQRGELLNHRAEFLEMKLLNAAGLFGSWTVFALSFGGICVAAHKLRTGAVPSLSECFVPVRERLGAFLRLSTLLFAILCVLFEAASLLVSGVFWGLGQVHVHLTPLMYFGIGWAYLALVLLILSRFALAIPALLLENCKVGESMFRSDAYTEGKWLILAALLTKSVAGGYVASMLPFWFAESVLRNIAVPSWFHWVLTALSITAVSVIEPTMFIGFTLLYLQKSNATAQVPIVVIGPAQPQGLTIK